MNLLPLGHTKQKLPNGSACLGGPGGIRLVAERKNALARQLCSHGRKEGPGFATGKPVRIPQPTPIEKALA